MIEPGINQAVLDASSRGVRASKDVSMAIEIARVGDLYEATVTPPHGGGVAWGTTEPLTAQALIDALRERGCHQVDIGDAFHVADPGWLRE